MALIKCPECGHDVSTLAENCPNCGAPVAARQKQEQNGNQIETKKEKETETENSSVKKKEGSPLTIIIVALIVAAVMAGIYFAPRLSKKKEENSPQLSSFQKHENDAVTGIRCEICGQRDAVIEYGGYDMCIYCYEYVKFGNK